MCVCVCEGVNACVRTLERMSASEGKGECDCDCECKGEGDGESNSDGDGVSYPNPQGNDFANISNGSLTATLIFNDTGASGSLTIDANDDKTYEVNTPFNQLQDFSDGASETTPLTFTQTGNTVTVTFDEGNGETFVVDFLISADGSLLIAAVTEVGATTFDDGSDGEEAFVELLIGVRSQ